MAKVEQGKSLNEIIKEQQQSIIDMGCDPAWYKFEETYNWFRLKQKLSASEQDAFREPMSAHF